jgi:hypothetical protein
MLQQTTPYFYIIKNKHTGLRYSGARWAVNCHPSEFMTESGYCTSSNTIAEIIKSDGLDVFEVEKIVTDFDGISAYDYETAFLVENDCAGSDQWYNCHNNMGFDFGSEGFKKHMIMKHGVENAMDSKEFKDKQKQTNLDRFGVEYTMQNTEVKEKAKQTNLGKFGVEHAAQNEAVKAKTKQTNLDRRGVEHPMHDEEVKAKLKTTNIDRYGAPHHTQSEAYRNTFYTCKHCDMKSNNASNMKRYHNDNCKHKPNVDSVV